MRCLLDTHAFLWFVGNDPQLSSTAALTIADGSNEIFFSIASAWEIAIKVSIGKLALQQNIDAFLPSQLQRNSFRLLPLTLDHTSAVSSLPLHHRDPFDRILISQSLCEGLSIISADAVLDGYSVHRIW